MENLLKTTMDIRANKLKEMKKMLKTNLSDLERSVVNLTIRDHQKTTRKLKLEYTKKLKIRVKHANETKKKISSSRCVKLKT